MEGVHCLNKLHEIKSRYLMAEIISCTVCESKQIEFDNCTSAGPHFRIGVFASTATNQLAPARATAQEVNSSRRKSGKKDQN